MNVQSLSDLYHICVFILLMLPLSANTQGLRINLIYIAIYVMHTRLTHFKQCIALFKHARLCVHRVFSSLHSQQIKEIRGLPRLKGFFYSLTCFYPLTKSKQKSFRQHFSAQHPLSIFMPKIGGGERD